MDKLTQVFEYESRPVRTVLVDGEPWFVAKDVCDVLEIANSSDALRRLDSDEVDSTEVTDSLGRNQVTNIVNEPGLYALILGSRKPEARLFKRWVTHEVLPSIRRTGVYSAQLPKTLSEALYLAAEQAAMLEHQQRLLEAAKPKTEFFDAVASSKDAIQIGDAAKVLAIPGMGRNKLFEFLREQGVLMKDNIPYQEYIDRGYFRTIEQKWTTREGETRISIKTLVYQRGLDYIRRLLKSESRLARLA